jgi:hypothetical protein
MTFKNRRGEMSWYVIAMVLAVIVLVVSLFVVPRIRDAQGQGTGVTKDTCTIAGGTCTVIQQGQSNACPSGTRIPASCPLTKEQRDAGSSAICCT